MDNFIDNTSEYVSYPNNYVLKHSMIGVIRRIYSDEYTNSRGETVSNYYIVLEKAQEYTNQKPNLLLFRINQFAFKNYNIDISEELSYQVLIGRTIGVKFTFNSVEYDKNGETKYFTNFMIKDIIDFCDELETIKTLGLKPPTNIDSIFEPLDIQSNTNTDPYPAQHTEAQIIEIINGLIKIYINKQTPTSNGLYRKQEELIKTIMNSDTRNFMDLDDDCPF